jgi:zinc transport system substrate-binding protein
MLIKMCWTRRKRLVCNALLSLGITFALVGLARADTSKAQSSAISNEQEIGATVMANKGKTLVASIRPLAFLLNELALPADKVIQLVSNNSSAHHYQLKVSDRRLLQSADLVVWVGPELELFLEKPLRQVRKAKAKSGTQPIVTLSDTPGIQWLDEAKPHKDRHPDDMHTDHKPVEGKQDEHDDHAHDEHSHDEHADSEKTHAKSGHDEHDDAGHEGHAHNGRDPHIWLNPINVQAMVTMLARRLGELSPENAAAYQQKAKSLIAALTRLDGEIAEQLAGVSDKAFTVLHPAYTHFINRYKLNQLDYVVINPESAIGAKHLYQLSQYKIVCVFGEAGQANQHVARIAASTKAKVGELDPLGSNLGDDASITDLIRQLADDFQTCLV